jgi:tubulin polyglutamylase TTLL6/13
MFMHLTNYSINKNSRMYSTDDEVGTKRKISTLNRILANEGYDVSELWANIDDVIIKTILSALPMLKHNYNASFPSHDMIQACFEILGMDILIDSKLKPYILEVNHSPSFHTSEQVDKEVKEALIRDTFQILNLTQDIRKKVCRFKMYPKFQVLKFNFDYGDTYRIISGYARLKPRPHSF